MSIFESCGLKTYLSYMYVVTVAATHIVSLVSGIIVWNEVNVQYIIKTQKLTYCERRTARSLKSSSRMVSPDTTFNLQAT